MSEDPHHIVLETRLALRPAEAAAALGVSERTLRDLAPELPRVFLTNRTVVYPVDGLRDWLREHARSEGADVDGIVDGTIRSLAERR